MDPSSPSLKDSVRAPSPLTSTSSSPAADKPISLTALTSDDNSSNTTTAPNQTSADAGHTSHVLTPPSSTGTTRKEKVEEDNALLLDSVSASGSTHTTDNNPGLAPQLPPPGAASSSSTSSSSGPSSSNQLTQQEQQQVEQYKDDIMLHTQLQLQLYLEDMEEAETAEIQAHIDQAAFAESLIYSANALDPLQDSLLPGGYNGFAGGSPGPLSPDATQMFQQQMISLESNALAAAAAADATTPFQLGGGGIGAGGGGLGGGGNVIGGGVGGGQGEHAHDRLDFDWAEMDEDDEDCLPPSETKYILYDDHVSPVSMAQALALLNDPLHEDLVVHVHSNNSNHYTHDGQDDNRQPLSMLGRKGDDSDTPPIYSTPLPLPSSLASFSDTRRINPVGATPWRINHTGYAHEEEIDDNYHPWEQQQHEEISRTGHSHTMGLPSPPAAAAASKYSQAGFFGNDNQRLQDKQQRFYGHDNDYAPLANEDGCDEEGNCEEENQQGRPSHRRGPDIYLNLAGTIISPINIHDIFFSQFYSRLVYLNLWDTNLGIWGAQAVGGLLADRVCRIQYLNLGSNRLEFEGILQLAGLYKNQSLIELDLSENQLGPKAIHSLQQVRLSCHFILRYAVLFTGEITSNCFWAHTTFSRTLPYVISRRW